MALKVVKKEAAAETMYEELLGACKSAEDDFAEQNPEETDRAFFQRLTQTIDGADEGIWNGLSKEAQEWYNGAVDELAKDDEDVTLPEGFTSKYKAKKKQAAESLADEKDKKARAAAGKKAAAAKEEAEEEGAKADPEEEEEAPKPKASSKKSAAKEPEKKSAEPSKRKPPPPREKNPNGAVATIRKYVISKPACTSDDIRKMLEKKGIEAKSATINATRTFTVATIEDIKAAGKWSD